jgi:hypothetical protein
MKSRFFVGVAVVLVLIWFVTLAAFPSALDEFKDFKVEMPALTMLWVGFYHIGGWLLLGAGVVGVALLLGMRWRLGWWLAFGMSVLLDVFCLSLAMPLIALRNNLSGGDDALLPLLIVTAPPLFPFWLLLVVAVNQLIKAALLFNRRAFFAR